MGLLAWQVAAFARLTSHDLLRATYVGQDPRDPVMSTPDHEEVPEVLELGWSVGLNPRHHLRTHGY